MRKINEAIHKPVSIRHFQEGADPDFDDKLAERAQIYVKKNKMGISKN